MPRLNRPNSDTQRVNAMQAAKAKYDSTVADRRAFSADTYARLDAFLPEYLREIQERGTALSRQAQVTASLGPERRLMRLYVSHFIMGLNNAILREELPASARPYYQLDVNGGPLPRLSTDADLMRWADNIVSGEAVRTGEGGEPLANPGAAQVQARRDALRPMLQRLSDLKTTYDSEQEDVAALWDEADDILQDVWDEVLFHYRRDEPSSLRRKAREWGVAYRPSPGERPTEEDYSVMGRILDQGTRQPREGVEVGLDGTDIIATTDSEGRFYLPFTTAGSYVLRVSAPGYMTHVQSVTIADSTLPEVEVALRPEPAEGE
jgi:hypothetical protein